MYGGKGKGRGKHREGGSRKDQEKIKTAERARLMWEGQVDMQQYSKMIADKVRTESYNRAIQKLVRNKVVVEIGTGPFSVLSIFCARAGARHVYAIEVNGWMIKKAQKAIDEAGYSDKITLIRGYSTLLDLPQAVDVVVQEVIGNIATEEGMILAIRDAQTRFRDPRSGSPLLFIPERVRTLVAAVSLTSNVSDWKGDVINEHRGLFRVPWICHSSLASESKPIEAFDFSQKVDLSMESICCLEILRDCNISGFLIYMETDLCKDIGFCSLRTSISTNPAESTNISRFPKILQPQTIPNTTTQHRDFVKYKDHSLPSTSSWQSVMVIFGHSVRGRAGDRVQFGFRGEYHTYPSRYRFNASIIRPQSSRSPEQRLADSFGEPLHLEGRESFGEALSLEGRY